MAAGNCVIYKPSSLSSLIGFDLPAIFKEAGLPDGVFNYCPGRGSVMEDKASTSTSSPDGTHDRSRPAKRNSSPSSTDKMAPMRRSRGKSG